MIESKKLKLIRKADAREPDANAIYHWRVTGDVPYFDGHFPGQPILPAVACIDASLECIRQELQLNQAPFLQKLKSAKFTGVVVPGDEVILTVSRLGSAWKIVWSKNGVQTADIRVEI